MKLLELLKKEELAGCQTVKIPKGQIMFQEDEECEYVGIVKSGLVFIVSYTLSGQEIVYNQIRENGIFGNNLLFSEKPFYKGNVIAKEDSEIVLINKEKLLKILQNNDKFLIEYLAIHANFSKQLNFTIKLLSLQSAEERFLYYLKEKSPLKIKSITALSESLFLTRETVSRLITKMVKNKTIIKNGKNIILTKTY